jgi:hypothetical protein
MPSRPMHLRATVQPSGIDLAMATICPQLDGWIP